MNKRRVVITGFGIISSLGNDKKVVLDSLLKKRSGIEQVKSWSESGMKSHIAGTIKDFDESSIRKEIGVKSRYMGLNSLYVVMAAKEAIEQSELTSKALQSEHTSCIVGSGFSATESIVNAGLKLNGLESRITPFDINKSMASSCSANLAFVYGLKGRNYSLSSACSTSSHNIGHAFELIQNGNSNIVLAGGSEEVSSVITELFNGMRSALNSSHNEEPEKASRPYDKARSGFVVSGGGGIVILEDLEHAIERKAKIYGEIIGFGATSDGHDAVQPHPDGDGAYRCMKQALESARIEPESVDYINTHATSTTLGDISESLAIRKLFKNQLVAISSTKSLSGHGIGAAGIHELIYCLLMQNNDFLAASCNIENLGNEFEGLNILQEIEHTKSEIMMSNSFGFGGTNATLILKKYKS